MKAQPLLGVSMMAETGFVSAILPLLEGNEIDVMEWSFDTFYETDEPQWLSDLLDFYSDNQRLLGLASIIRYLMRDGLNGRPDGFRNLKLKLRDAATIILPNILAL